MGKVGERRLQEKRCLIWAVLMRVLRPFGGRGGTSFQQMLLKYSYILGYILGFKGLTYDFQGDMIQPITLIIYSILGTLRKFLNYVSIYVLCMYEYVYTLIIDS